MTSSPNSNVEDAKRANQQDKMVMTRSMYKMMNRCLGFTHPALENQPQVKWVIVTRAGFEGYATFEDAYYDYPYQRFINGFAGMYKVAAETDRVAKVRVRFI